MSRKPREGIPERAVKRVVWTGEPDKQQWMEEHADMANDDLSAAFAERFGFPLSRPQITLWRQVNGRPLRPSRGGGRVLRPIGSEYVGKDGYVMYKHAMRPTHPGTKDNWMLKHVWVWVRENGPLPKGCNIYFADGDKRNFDPANLVPVPLSVAPVLNNRDLGYEWHDADGLRACMAHAMLSGKITDLEFSAPRPCKICGRPFVPEAVKKSRKIGNVATCRSCLDAGRKAPYGGDAGFGTCKVCGNPFKKSSPKRTRCDECKAANK